MGILQSRLAALKGEQVVVVMADHRAFRGKLVDFDDQVMVLSDVVEGSTQNTKGWEEPTVSTGLIEKVVTWQGVFAHENPGAEQVRLKDAIILLSGVLRMWEFSLKNAVKPEHVQVDKRRISTAAPPPPGGPGRPRTP